MYEVKVYKPDKEGHLKHTKNVSPDVVTDVGWTPFNRGNKKSSTPKYHGIGVELKPCAEDGCNNIVEEPRSKTCSKKCRLNRVRRKHIENTLKRRAKADATD